MNDQPDVAALRKKPKTLGVLGWRFVKPGTAPWDDHSYLSESELEDPEIVANVKAMTETNARIQFVLYNEDGEYLGYWLGADGKTPVSEAAVVKLDSEGQYELVGGCMASAVADGVDDDEEQDAIFESFGRLGITMKDIPEDATDPDIFRDAQFERFLNA